MIHRSIAWVSRYRLSVAWFVLSTIVIVVLALTVGCGKASAAAVSPKTTNYDALARRYHCGEWFHDWTDWQKHVRGFILYKPGTNPVVYAHVTGRMSDYRKYDYLIISLCAK